MNAKTILIINDDQVTTNIYLNIFRLEVPGCICHRPFKVR